MRFHWVAVAAGLAVMPVSSAYAQRMEAGVFGGWTLSDGVSGDPVLAGDGNIYDTVDVKDSGSWGFDVGVNVTDNFQGVFSSGSS
jgi:hypothetical protein